MNSTGHDPQAQFAWVPDVGHNRRWFSDASAPPPAYLLIRGPEPSELPAAERLWLLMQDGCDKASELKQLLKDYVVCLSPGFAANLPDGRQIPLTQAAQLTLLAGGDAEAEAFLLALLEKLVLGPTAEDARREAALREAGLLPGPAIPAPTRHQACPN